MQDDEGYGQKPGSVLYAIYEISPYVEFRECKFKGYHLDIATTKMWNFHKKSDYKMDLVVIEEETEKIVSAILSAATKKFREDLARDS